jgi:hypothetical protein
MIAGGYLIDDDFNELGRCFLNNDRVQEGP